MSRKSPTPGADTLPGLDLPVQRRDRRSSAQKFREPTIMDWLEANKADDRLSPITPSTLNDQHLVR